MRNIKFRSWGGSGVGMLYDALPLGPSVFVTDNPDLLPDIASGMTLMQYTGFHDALGAEIWEGDVVNHLSYPFSYVKWLEDEGRYIIYTPSWSGNSFAGKTPMTVAGVFTVVGHIYEDQYITQL